MGRKQEDQLHDKVNSVIGYARSNLRGVMLDTQLELLKKNKVTSAQIEAIKEFADTVNDRFRSLMPMLKPDKE